MTRRGTVLLLLLVGGAGVVVARFVPRDACGREDAPPCPSPRLENGLDTVLRRGEVCTDAGYLCSGGPGMMGGTTVMRWSLRKGILRVWAPPPPEAPDSVAAILGAAAVDGILEWDGHPFPIEVDDGRIPLARWDVEVLWRDARDPGDLGNTRMSFEKTPEGPRYHAPAVSLTYRSRETGAFASYWEVRATATHEMGHALGLGHSDRESDIMYPEASRGAREVSPRDVRTVEALYRLPNGAEIR